MFETASAPRLVEANPAPEDSYMPARKVWERYGICDMTLFRWIRDPDMGFPQPTYLGRYRYWRLGDLIAWERQACGRQAR